MILELVGSRILAPYVGTTLFVWTSLIGVILGSLSLGYWLGGKLADKKPDQKTLSYLLLLAGLFILLIFLVKDFVLSFIHSHSPSIASTSILAALSLFFLPSMTLGMVSPYAAKLKVHSLKTSGSTMGNLYALATLGSIAGTFLGGFILILYLGAKLLLLLLAMILIFTSFLSYRNNLIKTRLLVIFFLGVSILHLKASGENSNMIDQDTMYNRILIYDSSDYFNGRRVKLMVLGIGMHSAMYLDNDDLVIEYLKFFRLDRHFSPHLQSVLMLGGGGYSYPKELLRKYPKITVDVIEIDPQITLLAKKYFRLKEDPRLVTYSLDARVFINNSTKKYDAIYQDTYGASVPYQLTTLEAAKKMSNLLNRDGILITKVISGIEGEKGKLFTSLYLTLKEVFPQVYVFPIKKENARKAQTIVLVALKSKQEPSFSSTNKEINSYLQQRWIKPIQSGGTLLTDDYAPVDQYLFSALGW